MIHVQAPSNDGRRRNRSRRRRRRRFFSPPPTLFAIGTLPRLSPESAVIIPVSPTTASIIPSSAFPAHPPIRRAPTPSVTVTAVVVPTPRRAAVERRRPEPSIPIAVPSLSPVPIVISSRASGSRLPTPRIDRFVLVSPPSFVPSRRRSRASVLVALFEPFARQSRRFRLPNAPDRDKSSEFHALSVRPAPRARARVVSRRSVSALEFKFAIPSRNDLNSPSRAPRRALPRRPSRHRDAREPLASPAARLARRTRTAATPCRREGADSPSTPSPARLARRPRAGASRARPRRRDSPRAAALDASSPRVGARALAVVAM